MGTDLIKDNTWMGSMYMRKYSPAFSIIHRYGYQCHSETPLVTLKLGEIRGSTSLVTDRNVNIFLHFLENIDSF